jgi:hypothetical protein
MPTHTVQRGLACLVAVSALVTPLAAAQARTKALG